MKKILIQLVLMVIVVSALSQEAGIPIKPVKDSHTNEITSLIKGVIVNHKNKPLSSVKISIGKFSATTNWEGYFEIKYVGESKQKITFSHKNYQEININIVITKSIMEIEKITMFPKKEKKAIVSGFVKNIENKPLNKITVFMGKFNGQTNKEGYFEITNVPYGEYNIIIENKKYEPFSMKILVNKANIFVNNLVLQNISSEKLSDEMKESLVEDDEDGNEDIEIHKDASSLKVKENRTGSGKKSELIYSVEGTSVSESADISNEEIGDISLDETAHKPEADLKEEIVFPKTAIDKTKPSAPSSAPKVSGLKASFADDNKQFNYFLHFLEKYKHARHFDLNITERYIIQCFDAKDNSLPDIMIKIFDENNKLVEHGKTYSDGTYLFFPKIYSEKKQKYKVQAKYRNTVKEMFIDEQDPHNISLIFDELILKQQQAVPLDILFILDTTGSMGEEINRLKDTIELINMNISALSPKPDIRFGMVLYKDRKDNYVTKLIPFTTDLTEFQVELAKVKAQGGGDMPEDLQTALKDAVQNMEWRTNGIHLIFIITDAAPHLDYNQEYTYVDACKEAKSKGIKLFSIGTGGLDINGEYVLRQISQFTYANYVFLTYGEKGESAGGSPGSVSHHTGENFQTDKLEAIIIQLVKKEIIQFSGKDLEESDEFIEANPIDEEKREETLEKLFLMAISQLHDYSTIRLEKNTPVAIAPIITTLSSQNSTAEYFYENLVIALSKNDVFKTVARKDLQPILDELKFQLDALSNNENAAELGKFMGADLLITAKMYSRENYYEIFLKLMNVETVEILSVTKLKINKKLGI